MIRAIENRVAQFLGVKTDHFEPLCVLRYHPGEEFKVHHDGDFRPQSLIIYLNGKKVRNFVISICHNLDVEEGGETAFPALGIALSPKKGFGLSWRNCLPSGAADMRLLHAGLPVTKGVKYCIPIFVNQKLMAVQSE